MIVVQKKDVASWLIAEYLANLHVVNEKIRFYERKYAKTWKEFSEAIKGASKEDFAQWDDYIEWKAYVRTAEALTVKIDEVKRGNFEIA